VLPGLALVGIGAGLVMARSPALSPLVHRAFANGLDVTYLVAAGFGVIAAIVVFTLVRPARASTVAPHGQQAVTART